MRMCMCMCMGMCMGMCMCMCIYRVDMACDPVMCLSHASPGMLDQLEWMAVAMKTQRDATGLWA